LYVALSRRRDGTGTQPARVVAGIRGSDELYEFLQRPHDTGRFLERTGFTD
jgi:hypothetical protein